MNIRVPIWCIVHRSKKEVLVPTQDGSNAVPLFSTSESVDNFINQHADRSNLFPVRIMSLEGLGQLLEEAHQAGRRQVAIDPNSDIAEQRLLEVSRLIENLPSAEECSVYRSEAFFEWQKSF